MPEQITHEELVAKIVAQVPGVNQSKTTLLSWLDLVIASKHPADCAPEVALRWLIYNTRI